MANRKELPPDIPPSAPLWVVTFGDMVSLLVTFFVLLFTFSSTDTEKLDPIAGTLSGGRGVMTKPKQSSRSGIKPNEVPRSAEASRNGDPSPSKRTELESDDALVKRFQSSEFNVAMDVEKIGDGVRVLLEGDDLFSPGSTRIKESSVQTLREIALFFRAERVHFVVEAHVDSETPGYSGYASPTAMTMDMAMNVAEFLRRETEWEASRIGTVARGSSVPVAPNDQATGRQKNRRIEIFVVRGEEKG